MAETPDKTTEGRRIFLFGEINEEKTEKTIESLLDLESKDPIKDIIFYIDSFGGMVDSAMAIHDVIRLLRCRVAGVCVGKAMSAGAFILMSCTKGLRFMTTHARLMMHEMSGGAFGSVSDIDMEIEEMQRLQALWIDLMVKYTKMSLSEVRQVTKPTSSYMTAKQAQKFGIVDEILVSNKEIAKKLNVFL